MLGMGTGAIVGLDGITPVADAVGPIGAVARACGLRGGGTGHHLEARHHIDDTFEVFANHRID